MSGNQVCGGGCEDVTPGISKMEEPASPSSSPQEFSFTVSLNSTASRSEPTPQSPIAIDLSPADDIFFQGHLLPLQLLSHLSISPRPSNFSDMYTLPSKTLSTDTATPQPTEPATLKHSHFRPSSETHDGNRRGMPKSFSFFRFVRLRKRPKLFGEACDKHEYQVSNSSTLKKCVHTLREFVRRKREKRVEWKEEAIKSSYFGNLRGYISTPVSRRSSPRNSGNLACPASLPGAPSASSMEEFQAAIEAAIAHCKKSIKADDDDDR